MTRLHELTENRWRECEIDGRMCQVSRDGDGDVRARFIRRASDEAHPDKSITVPAPGRAGWVIDLFWPVAIAGLLLTLFLCVGLALV